MSTSRPRGRRARRRQPIGNQTPKLERLETRRLLSAAFPNVGTQPVGPLTGKIVYTSGGHGWAWNDTLNRWATDRGDNNEIVEDFGNQEQMSFYADYILRAGGTLVPMRPVGRQLNEVIVDNDSPGASFSGSWSDNTTGPRWYDDDYGAVTDPIKYRFATTSATESAVATYTPNIPQAGFYPVYTWVAHSGNRANQLYKINHTGGQMQIRVDHRKVGNGWVYLGTYHFSAGSSAGAGSVQISNEAAPGGNVIADAIRFGNGMGDVVNGPSGIGVPGGSISGYPREDENSLHWLWRGVGLGVSPSTVLGTSNVSAPARMAEHMNADTNAFGTSVYIGFHSNAGGGRGAVGLINSSVSSQTPNQSALALYTGRQINQDMQALNGVFEHNWSTRTTHTFSGAFGEINDSRFTNASSVVEMDATIIEVAFHDSVEDAQLMRSARVRDQLARSTYEATLEYFINHGGPISSTTLPSAPRNVSAVSNASGEVTVSWIAGPTSPVSVHGNAPIGYRIFISTDGYGFDGGVPVPGGSTTSFTIAGLDPTVPHYFKVAAENSGGQSHASEVTTALPGGGPRQILVVNGFDRLDRLQNFRYAYAHTGDGLVDRVWGRYNNSLDYVAQVHAAIDAASPGAGVDGASNEAVLTGAIDLADYQHVVWILGSESTADDTFSSAEQSLVQQFITAGGDLFVTGSEIGWDLDAQNNGRTFFRNTLMAGYGADSSNSYSVNGQAGGIFEGLSFTFSNGAQFSSLDGQLYNVRTADVINPQTGAATALRYSTGTSAAVQYLATDGGGSVVVFGFPFESITSASTRATVMGRVLDFFNTAPPLPAPGAPVLAAGSDSGTSSGDGITNFNNGAPALALEFTVPDTTPGATVRIFADGVQIGSAVASGASTVVVTDGATVLADGTRTITATQTGPGGAPSQASPPLAIEIDTAAPTITLAAFAFANAQEYVAIFSENVGPSIAPADLVLENLTSGQTIDPSNLQVAYNGDANFASVTFPGLPGGILADGNYRATALAAGITDVAGNPLPADHVLEFFFLNGDANHDGTVNLADFNILAGNFGQTGRNFSQGNFDYDPAGNVNLADFNILAARFGTTLSPAAGAGLAMSASPFAGAKGTGSADRDERDEREDDLLA